MESARVAGRDDLEELARMADAALDEQRDARGGALLVRRDARPRPAEGWLADVLHDPAARVVVGTITIDGGDDDDGGGEGGGTHPVAVPVGYAVAHVEELRDGSRLAVVDELFTEPPARGVAVGEAMMESLLEWARDQGCFGIDAMALPGNRETKNFFERFGLTARAIVVHKSLEAPTGGGAG